MGDFTPTQGRYLAFIHAYTALHGCPPSEAEIAGAMCVSPPSVNQMVRSLEKRGLILRRPGQARSLVVLVPEDQIPPWNGRKHASRAASASRKTWRPPDVAPPGNLYVLAVYLMGGPVSAKFTNTQISRAIEIRGDQTLENLHEAIFSAYDRFDSHLYQFQFGKRPYDPAGPNYSPGGSKEGDRDARTATLDSLGLKLHRCFGYLFDFGDEWFHQIDVEKIERAIPTISYPRVIKRVGKSPPQYAEDA